MKIKVDTYCNKDSYYIGFGITFWYHRHMSVCPWHFDLILDLFAWYIEFTIGKEDPEEE